VLVSASVWALVPLAATSPFSTAVERALLKAALDVSAASAAAAPAAASAGAPTRRLRLAELRALSTALQRLLPRNGVSDSDPPTPPPPPPPPLLTDTGAPFFAPPLLCMALDDPLHPEPTPPPLPQCHQTRAPAYRTRARTRWCGAARNPL
jgi:hypothetical protein